jgi:hypothetical protein
VYVKRVEPFDLLPHVRGALVGDEVPVGDLPAQRGQQKAHP